MGIMHCGGTIEVFGEVLTSPTEESPTPMANLFPLHHLIESSSGVRVILTKSGIEVNRSAKY